MIIDIPYLTKIVGALAAIYLMVWLFYIVPVSVVFLPARFLARRRVHWMWTDVAILIIPYWIWAVCSMANDSHKSLSNFAEAFWLGLIAATFPLIRVAIGNRIDERRISIGLLILASVIGIGLWWFVPGLPE